MNRRRDEPSTSASVFLAVILAAAIIAAGGVLHVFYKNRQIQITREIDAIDRRVEQCRLDIRTSSMRMDQLLNRFVIRKQLQENGSTLRPISANSRRGDRSRSAAPPQRRIRRPLAREILLSKPLHHSLLDPGDRAERAFGPLGPHPTRGPASVMRKARARPSIASRNSPPSAA